MSETAVEKHRASKRQWAKEHPEQVREHYRKYIALRTEEMKTIKPCNEYYNKRMITLCHNPLSGCATCGWNPEEHEKRLERMYTGDYQQKTIEIEGKKYDVKYLKLDNHYSL